MSTVEILFWPTACSNDNGLDTAISTTTRDHVVRLQQRFRIGFVIGWRCKDYGNGESMIVAGSVQLPINDDRVNSKGENIVSKILEQNRNAFQSKYDTICSNIEYLKSMSLPKSQQYLVDDLSILGLCIDLSSSIVWSTEDVFNWLSSTIGVDSAQPSISYTWKLFTCSPNNISPPKVFDSRKDTTSKQLITKQIVLYDSNIPVVPSKLASLENVQVLWNHHPFSDSLITSSINKQVYDKRPQPWLIRLTQAAYILQLVAMDSDLKELVPMGRPPLAVDSRECEDSINTPKSSPLNHFLLRHSLFIRHCYSNYDATIDMRRSIFPIVKVLRRMCSKTALISMPHDRQPTISNFTQIVREHIYDLNRCIQLYIDTIFGIFIGMMIFYYGVLLPWTKRYDLDNNCNAVTIALNMIQPHYTFLKMYLRYLEAFPLGFKLNQDLLYNTGCEIQRIWELHEDAISTVIIPLFQSRSFVLQSIPMLIMSMFSITFGASGSMALMFDIVHFGTLHMSIFAWFTVRIYYYELYLLSALWKLFRGKKCNILRDRRTDSMEYDSMQLLVGTILFAIVLFLYTTIFVGHVFYTILYFITVMMALPTLFLYTLLQSLPCGILWLRHCRPGRFTRTIYLSEIEHEYDASDSISTMDVTRLCYHPCTYNDIVADKLLPRIQGPSRWIIQSFLLSLVGVPSSWNDFLDAILPMSQIS